MKIIRIDPVRLYLAFSYLFCYFAEDIGYRTFKVPDACLPCVLYYFALQGFNGNKRISEIKLTPKVVVTECVVLLRVKHFKQSCRRVSPEIHTHLIYLIHHKHRVVCPRLLYPLDYPSRKSAYICPPVSPDLCLISNPAQGY